MKKISKNSQNSVSNSSFAFANLRNDAILCFMGVETQGQAGAVTVKAATSNNNIAQSPCFFGGFAGADLRKHFRHGLVPVFLTPSQSRFFCAGRRKPGEAVEQKNKEICEMPKHAIPAITVTTPPGVCLQPSFSVPAPELIQ